MRLTALVAGPDHVCARYRLAAFRAAFEAAGHTLDLCSYPRRLSRWFAALRRLRSADVVVLQRRLPHPVALSMLRSAARYLVFDFDDAVFQHDSYDPRGPESPALARRFAAVVRAADAVVAGNEFLAVEVRRFAEPNRVRAVPTCLDLARYRPAGARRRNGIKLVWIGSASTLQGLERVRPVLEEVGRACRGTHLKLVCDRFIRLANLPTVEVPWSEATEAAELADADVGISWLPDDRWSRGKCGLKVLQYMAAGLPVIANPVGVQTDLVRHGVNGFLADSADDWIAAVQVLAADAQLRSRMGAAGRRRVEQEFTIDHGAATWVQLLSVLSAGRSAKAS